MAKNTTTLLALEKLFSESIGDHLEFDVTTDINNDNSIVSTTLKQFDYGRDDYFNGWWVYITTFANAGVERKVSDYATATGTLTVLGAALTDDVANTATCQLHRYRRTNKKNALIRACEEIYPTLHKKIDDITLVTGNILIDSSFEEWTSSSALEFYTANGGGTLAQTTTAGLYRGARGTTSMKYTAGAADDYVYISSKTFPRLLDLMDKTVDAYVWAYPEVADDAHIVIYTVQADGTAQTLTSTTACPATAWTKLELENQSLNDDLVEIQIRFEVDTNAKYVYFDDAYVSGMQLSEYLLPDDFAEGHLSRVIVQNYGYSDEAMYDLQPFITRHRGVEYPFDIIDDGTYTLLKLGATPTSQYRMRLLGYAPLEALSADTDTITCETHRLPLLVAKARMIFWERESVPVSPEDTTKFQIEFNKALGDYNRLFGKLRMPKPIELIKV
jgi:hypothetical protein